MTYLSKIKSRPALPPGPGSCSRISCDWGEQIWWCNDSDERKELDSWQEVVNAAEDITRQCFWFSLDMKPMTGGQIFEPGGWNVVIRAEGAKC
jgi:hypothetical protein